jgi:SAM-dependent methyltransferase
MLLDAHVLEGVDFSSTLTLGHLELNILPHEAKQFRAVSNARIGEGKDVEESLRWGAYADGFLKHFLGARTIHSVDYSTFEGADIVHDMNLPTPTEMDDRFDVVIDGGTLEHVYNIPVAWENCMRSLKVGGRLFLFTTANNYCGHGFYQFSPELFFRLFTEVNGFKVEKLHLVEYVIRRGFSMSPTCYQVTDPAALKSRAMLCTKSRVLCFVQARKIATKKMSFPLQSDYVQKWSGESVPQATRPINTMLRRAHAALPLHLRVLSLEYYQRLYTWRFRNRRFYRRIPYLDFSAYRSGSARR